MTAGKRIRERAFLDYRPHANSASILLGDGDALDSGTAIIIDSNIGHLQYEGCRHLFSSLGGPRVSFVNALLPYTGYDDGPPPVLDSSYSGTPSGVHQYILWGPRTCCRFGPFDFIADRVADTGGGAGRAVLRPVRTVTDVFSAVTDYISTLVIAAMTLSPDRDALFRGEYLALQSAPLSFGRAPKTVLTLTPNEPVTPAMETRWTCRDSGTVGGVAVSQTESTVVAGYIWIGVLFLNNTNQTCFVNSMSAFEMRDGTE